MGQKIVPTSLRLQINKQWDSKWVASLENYSNLFFFDYELRKFINFFFNKKKIHLQNLKIFKNSNNFFIYIFINTKIKIKNKKKNTFTKYLIKKQLENLLNKIFIFNFKINIINLNIYFFKKKKLFKKFIIYFKKNLNIVLEIKKLEKIYFY